MPPDRNARDRHRPSRIAVLARNGSCLRLARTPAALNDQAPLADEQLVALLRRLLRL